MSARTGWRYEVETKTIREVPSNQWVASMDSWDAAQDHAANARLIAAAPELLGWLEKAVQMAGQQYRGGDDAPMNSAWQWLAENASAAIAKAKGDLPLATPTNEPLVGPDYAREDHIEF